MNDPRLRVMRPCYVFDIDGTVADCSHRLHHIYPTGDAKKDWDSFFAACPDDKPIAHICELARDLIRAGRRIVFVSARSDVVRAETETWIYQHIGPFEALYMRRADDHRDDDILKRELLAELRRDGFEPIMAFDDRDRVVKTWRAMGIPCAQVAPGTF